MWLASTFIVPVSPAVADDIRSAQWYLNFLNVAQAHRYTEGLGVRVAVIDTGVDATHPDLVGNVISGADTYAGGTGDGRRDIDGHGTRMAAIIGAHGHGPGNSLGALGIAPKATILPVSVGVTTISNADAAGIAWATDHDARVISISRGGLPDRRTEKAIENAIVHDIVVVAAVGNAPLTSVQYPAGYPGVVAVAGVDEKGNHGTFSVTGSGVTLAAPGANVVTAVLDHGYGVASGTSDSAAIVAGVVALVRAQFPKLSAVEVIHRLTATAIDKGPRGRDSMYGYGIVNLVGALTANVPPLSSSPPAPSSPPGLSVGRGGGRLSRVWLWVALGIVMVVAVIGMVVLVRRRDHMQTLDRLG
jgi:type VII secretion-associated serine protease mycosin